MTESLAQVNRAELAFSLPPHIAFTQSLAANIRFSLSNSCAESSTVAELCQRAGKSLGDLQLTYASLAGSSELRSAIVDFHRALNLAPVNASASEPDQGTQNRITAENVLTFCGAQEALAAIYRCVLSPGDEVVVFTPNYPSLVTMAQQLGAKVIALALSEANAWQMDLDRLAAALTNKTRLIVINSPHNPSGSVITTDQAKQILALAQQYDCYLLADDVSQASNYHKIPLAHNYLSYDKSILVSVMSKSLGLAGIRLGWALSPDQALLQRMLALKTSGSICCSAVDEQLALWALQQRDSLLRRNNAIISDNIAHFTRFIANNGQRFSWHPPQAGIMTLVRARLALPVALWSKQLAMQTGLLVLPAYLFGLDGEYFRLGLGQRGFADALIRFQQFLDDNAL